MLTSGLSGIIVGTLITVIYIWVVRTYQVIKGYFHQNLMRYTIKMVNYTLAVIVGLTLSLWLSRFIRTDILLLELLLKAVICVIVPNVISVAFTFSSAEFKHTLAFLKNTLRKGGRQMKLSIIIISYNEIQYLSQAIESCLNQDCDFPFEIIIGDDGSTDGSIDVIQQYREKYPDKIRYFVMDRSDAVDVIPSIRVSNVLKRGFQEAVGAYITVLSGDDLLLDTNKLSVQVEYLEKHPHFTSTYTDYKMFWNDGREKPAVMRTDCCRALFWGSVYMHISCFVFHRAALDYLLDRFCDDIGLIFSIFCAGKSKHLSQLAFGYRQRDYSIMHSSDELELNILEVAICQDVVNRSGPKSSSLARFAKSMRYVFNHREKLQDEKYRKYLASCSQYGHNYLGEIAQFDSLSAAQKRKLKQLLLISMAFHYLYVIMRELETGIRLRCPQKD